jgi:hypothetical protein
VPLSGGDRLKRSRRRRHRRGVGGGNTFGRGAEVAAGRERASRDEERDMNVAEVLRRVARPLASRKVRVALVTVLAAFAAEWGLRVQEELVLTILGVGAALILGIAHEDHGRKAGPGPARRPFPPARGEGHEA